MYEDRIAKGAALLDKVRPSWFHEVNCDRLSMESCDDCMMGQLYGKYYIGFIELIENESDCILFSAAECGFTLYNREQIYFSGHPEDVISRFKALADAWRSLIKTRLEVPA
jgi:hypothetical protein